MLQLIDLKKQIELEQERIKQHGYLWQNFHGNEGLIEQYRILNGDFIQMEYELKHLNLEDLGYAEESILTVISDLVILCDQLKISPIKLYEQVKKRDSIFWTKDYSDLVYLGLELYEYINNQNKKKGIESLLEDLMQWIAYDVDYFNHRIERG